MEARDYLKQFIKYKGKKIGVIFATSVNDKFGVGVSLSNTGRDTKSGRVNAEKFDAKIGEALAFKRAVTGEPILKLERGNKAKEVNEQVERFWSQRARLFFHDKLPLQTVK